MLDLPVDPYSNIHCHEDWAHAIVGSEVYGPAAMKTYQLHIDTAILRFMPRLERSLDKVIDLSEQLLDFSSEVLSETLLSRNTLSLRNTRTRNVADAGFLNRLKNIVSGVFLSRSQTVEFNLAILQEIRKRRINDYEKRDILGSYIAVQQKSELAVNEASLAKVAATCLTHGIAPLAACLNTVLSLLYASPLVLSKLRTEVDAKWREGMLSDPVRMEEAAQMPYLTAVVNEGLASLPEQHRGLQSRVVANEGFVVNGVKLPSGTKLRLGSEAKEQESLKPERSLSRSSHDRSLTGVFGGGSGACRGYGMFYQA